MAPAAGAGHLLQSRGETLLDILLPRPSRSREWLKIALLQCQRCQQVSERRRRWSIRAALLGSGEVQLGTDLDM